MAESERNGDIVLANEEEGPLFSSFVLVFLTLDLTSLVLLDLLILARLVLLDL